ncbi:hypothetical protein JW766_00575 [Candidatus Dojkabacteria bacterium]|nr:hypothetical protein [Candidatus Dojkabacteria bacterium]
MKKEKTIRIVIIVLMLLVLLALHILGPSYFAPNSIFINSFLVDILLPCYLFLLLTFNLYSLPQSFVKYKKQLKITFAIGVFLIGFIVETLQYFGVPILGSTFDILDYPMYFLGTLFGVGIDIFILRISKKYQVH